MFLSKFCGAAILAGCGFFLAQMRKRDKLARAAYLHALGLALLRMRTAITERLEPLPDILEREANDHESEVSDFFKDAADTWKVCGRLGTAISGARTLPEEARGLLRELSETLGVCEAEVQGAALTDTARKLDTLSIQIKEEADTRAALEERLFPGLCIAAAILVI